MNNVAMILFHYLSYPNHSGCGRIIMSNRLLDVFWRSEKTRFVKLPSAPGLGVGLTGTSSVDADVPIILIEDT